MEIMKLRKKSIFTLLLTLLIVGINLLWTGWKEKENTPPVKELPEGQYKVTRVIDGDTIVLETGEKVRYIGINSPEMNSKNRTTKCFAEKSLDKNKELVEGKIVKLEKDISETDKYDRLLRYVFVDGMFVNEYLVREGYAKVSTFPPDVAYQETFLQAERISREEKRGLWGKVCP